MLLMVSLLSIAFRLFKAELLLILITCCADIEPPTSKKKIKNMLIICVLKRAFFFRGLPITFFIPLYYYSLFKRNYNYPFTHIFIPLINMCVLEIVYTDQHSEFRFIKKYSHVIH